MYNETVLDHFRSPRNVGVIGNPDGHARVESQVHNDLIELYIRVKDDTIAEIKYRVHGCVAAIASSSCASELALGMSLDQAAHLSPEQVSEALGGLPESKITCSVLAPQALREAIQQYLHEGGSRPTH